MSLNGLIILCHVQLSQTALTLFWYAAGFNPSPRAGEGL
jgi:hypothetical protein